MKKILIAIAIVMGIALGYAAFHMRPYNIHEGEIMLRSQSWDQENLQKNDFGCPLSIYIAPGGNLKQCP